MHRVHGPICFNTNVSCTGRSFPPSHDKTVEKTNPTKLCVFGLGHTVSDLCNLTSSFPVRDKDRDPKWTIMGKSPLRCISFYGSGACAPATFARTGVRAPCALLTSAAAAEARPCIAKTRPLIPGETKTLPTVLACGARRRRVEEVPACGRDPA